MATYSFSCGGDSEVAFESNNILTIDSLDIGMSVEGVKEYQQKIESLMSDLKEKMRDLSKISNALDSGWAGQSKVDFLYDMAQIVSHAIYAMDLEYEDLENRFQELKNNYHNQDNNMLVEGARL